MAVESTDKPVKIEVEILQDRPARALLEASRWAAMLCVGSMGLKHSTQGRIGSTAAALGDLPPIALSPSSTDTTRCRRNKGGWWPKSTSHRTSDGVLRRAVDEAQLRRRPSARADRHGSLATPTSTTTSPSPTATGWRRRSSTAGWPNGRRATPISMSSAVAVHGSTLNYLAKNAQLDPAARRRRMTAPTASPNWSARRATARFATPTVQC